MRKDTVRESEQLKSRIKRLYGMSRITLDQHNAGMGLLAHLESTMESNTHAKQILRTLEVLQRNANHIQEIA